MFVLYVCLVLLVVATSGELRPNFVFILTDDQDLVLESLNYMKTTTNLIGGYGITFNNFYVNSPICCPSRSSILTGKYPHNVRVFNNSINGGCSSLNWQQKHEGATIASVLKSALNYTTFYAGKYLNQYGNKKAGGTRHVPPGYDWWLGLEGNSKYYNYTLSINGTSQFFSDDYLTDKIAKFGLDFLNKRSGDNFFMMLAPPACHAPFTPAPRHRGEFPALKTIRKLPFNATPVDKHWLVEMPPIHLPEDVSNLDEIYRNRIRSLLAVDEMVGAIIHKLEEKKLLENTYVLITSDNGFHIGQFTLPWDKRQPYETDIKAPLLIRGPQISAKSQTDYPISAIDLAPTILDLAGGQLPGTDGISFKDILFNQNGPSAYDRYILIEYWGEGDERTVSPQCPWGRDGTLAECSLDNWCKCQDSKNNTYSCVLRLSPGIKEKFCVFEGGFIEVYDLVKDPHEMDNLDLSRREIDEYLMVLEELKNK